MTLDSFFDNFALLTDAPNAVDELKAIIRQIAIRGKLLAQKFEDEPASKLIQETQVKKQQLVKEKKIREVGSLPEIELHEISYEIPEGWEWVRFGNITICRDGERIPLSREERATRQGEFDYYGASGVIDTIDGFLFDKPLLLIGEDGANLINRSTPIAFIASGKYWVNNHAHVLDAVSFDCLKYLELYFNAIDLKPFVTGTAQPKMNQAKMNSIPISLPPLAEQKRIVEKCDRLLILCDEIEKRQQQRQESLLKMNEGAISQLLTAQNPDDFHHHWQAICNNFDLLYSIPETIPKLRQAILQLVFSGKLTKEELGDDAVDELLKNIKSARLELLKETRFRDPQNLKGKIQDEEVLFNIPKHWAWSRIGYIFLISSGTTPNRLNHSYFENGTEYWVKTTDLNNDLVLSCEEKITKQAVIDCNLKYYPPGTVCVALYGGAGTIGKSGLLGIETTINQSVCGIYPNKYVEPKYLHLYLKLIRPLWMNFAASLRKAPNINAGVVNNMVFPLPPLAEQKRIVAKVDSLLSLCDALEAKLKAARDSSSTLMEIAAKQVL